MEVRIAYWVENTFSEGPGKRFAVWFQGCSIKCDGCITKELWDFNGGKKMNISELLEKIRNSYEKNRIEGVSILGGEPFDQRKPLSELVMGIKELGLSIIVFTGYIYEELKSKNDFYINNVLNTIDVIVDGPYIKELYTENLYLRGSSNQRIVMLSSRYSEADFKRKNSFDLKYKNGKLLIVGFPFRFINNGRK